MKAFEKHPCFFYHNNSWIGRSLQLLKTIFKKNRHSRTFFQLFHTYFYQLLNCVNLSLTYHMRYFEQFIYYNLHMFLSMNICICVWIYLSICLPNRLFISLLALLLCLPSCLLACFPACVNACQSTSIFLSVSLFVCFFVCLVGCLHICLSAYLTAFLPVCLSVTLSVYWGEYAGNFSIFLQNWLIY